MKINLIQTLSVAMCGFLLAGCGPGPNAKPSLTISAPLNVSAYVNEPVTINGQLDNPPNGAVVQFTAQPGKCVPESSSSASSTIFYPVEQGDATIVAKLVLNGKTLTSASTIIHVLPRAATSVVRSDPSPSAASTERAVAPPAPSLSKTLTDWSYGARPSAGAFFNPGEAFTADTYVEDSKKGDVARISYDVSKQESFAGFWTKWPSLDGLASKWKALQIDLRGSPDSTTRLKIEIKAKSLGVRAAYITGIPANDWRTFTLPFASFRTVRSDFNGTLDEIVFTFEQQFVDHPKGAIFVGKMSLVSE